MGQTLYRTMMIRGSNGESRCRGAGESCRGKGKVGRGVDESVDASKRSKSSEMARRKAARNGLLLRVTSTNGSLLRVTLYPPAHPPNIRHGCSSP